jgi:hypothetical protein
VVWNLLEPAIPQKILQSPNPVVSFCLGPGHAPAVLAGTSSGSICLWDTSESNCVHQSLTCEGGEAEETGRMAVRNPTYVSRKCQQTQTLDVNYIHAFKD